MESKARFLLLTLFVVVPLTGPILSPSRPGSQAQPTIIDASKYATLQEAFDAVPQSGGLVKLPPGTLELTAPLVLTRQDTRVEGSGPATHLINRNTTGLPALIVRAANRQDSDLMPRKEARLWRVQLANFRISGNPQSGDGVLALGVNEIFIHALWLDRNGGHGVRLADCYENPRITDCNITYNGKAGIHLSNRSWNPVIANNHLEENLHGIECISIYNASIVGNNFDDQLQHGIIFEDSWGGVIASNMVEQCRGIGVLVSRDCFGFAISANMIGHNSQGGVELRDAWGCTVSGNTFSINHERALTIGPGSGRITVTGNNFSNSYIGEGVVKWDVPATGVHLKDSSDISLTGNIFAGLKEKPLLIEGECKRIAAVGNVVADLPENVPTALSLPHSEGSVVGLNVPRP